ncbi:MAG TPA: iron ABC transporter permease [Candidatus Lustribacter sp.]|nr:iron ABC transporter permease [Candidatus Lustribacter sp.]
MPLAAAFALAVGGATIAPHDFLTAILHPNTPSDAATILWSLRLPRIAIAATVGASLALAGTLMQALLRNPLIDPYITGVSSGAGAAIAIAATLGVALAAVPAIGFVAGLATAVLVAVLARQGSGLNAERLILAGVSISALMSAFIALALTELAQGNASAQIIAWLAGSLAGRGWVDLAAAAPYAMTGAVLGIATIPALNVVRVGERRAVTLGVDIVRLQWILLASAALLTAAAVALSGLVGFVGLIVPHLARRLIGADLRLGIPAAIALGAALVIVADAASRALLAPLEIPLGVLLAFIGVPAFLYLYLRGTARAYI